ncbi:MAG: molybdate ABC transporter substrate-binding protein [Methylobacteriaceae bacterium]|nr:molybdate ABC transporter substrate-binding protein [Methylobacteriaceae bacterium]
MPPCRAARSFVAILALLAGLTVAVSTYAASGTVTVFAAASLKNALDNIVKAYDAATGRMIVVSYAASSALAKQIEQDAPADIFISADLDWMDYLAKRNLIKPESRLDLLGNRIVLIAPSDRLPATPLTLAPNAPLLSALGGGRLAMADVAAVPAGKYGKAALENLGIWESVKDHVAQAENVRAALALVARGEAPLGIVYATDARAEPGVTVVATFPDSSHPPIIYPAAIVAKSNNPDAASFFAYLHTRQAAAFFEKEGFTVLP